MTSQGSRTRGGGSGGHGPSGCCSLYTCGTAERSHPGLSSAAGVAWSPISLTGLADATEGEDAKLLRNTVALIAASGRAGRGSVSQAYIAQPRAWASCASSTCSPSICSSKWPCPACAATMVSTAHPEARSRRRHRSVPARSRTMRSNAAASSNGGTRRQSRHASSNANSRVRQYDASRRASPGRHGHSLGLANAAAYAWRRTALRITHEKMASA